MTLEELLELMKFRVTEAGEFTEVAGFVRDTGYVGNCWYYSSSKKMAELFAIFNIDTKEIYEIRLFDFMEDISYDIMNPKFEYVWKSTDNTEVRRINLSDNIGEFKEITNRLLELK